MAKRQAEIPGTERKVNKKVRAAAEAYVEVRDRRMDLTKEEVDAKAKLVAEMKAAGLTDYVDEDADIEVTISLKEDVKVKRLRPKGEEE